MSGSANTPGIEGEGLERAVEAALNSIYGSKSDSFHHEVEQALLAALPALREQFLGEVKPHSHTVGHLNSIATLLDGMRTGMCGIPIDTQRDVDFLRQLADALSETDQ